MKITITIQDSETNPDDASIEIDFDPAVTDDMPVTPASIVGNAVLKALPEIVASVAKQGAGE